MTIILDFDRKVELTDAELSAEQALKDLRSILQSYVAGVYRLTRDDINHNQFDALISITYSIRVAGFKSSGLLREVNPDLNDPGIEKAFLAYRYATINGMKSRCCSAAGNVRQISIFQKCSLTSFRVCS